MTMLINEGSSGVYTAILRDAQGNPLLPGDIASLKLTLSDKKTGTVINGREAQQCVPLGGASGVGLHPTSGLLTWLLDPADAAVVNQSERHPTILALFVIRTVTQTQLTHQAEIKVINLAKFPAA